MAITATKTVEVQTGAARPDGRPAPGTHRVLACSVLAVNRSIGARLARAITSIPSLFAGREPALLFLVLSSLQQRAAGSSAFKVIAGSSPPAWPAATPRQTRRPPGPAAAAASGPSPGPCGASATASGSGS